MICGLRERCSAASKKATHRVWCSGLQLLTHACMRPFPCLLQPLRILTFTETQILLQQLATEFSRRTGAAAGKEGKVKEERKREKGTPRVGCVMRKGVPHGPLVWLWAGGLGARGGA